MTTATTAARVSAFLYLPTPPPPPQKLQEPLSKQLVYINGPQTLSINHARTCSIKFIPVLRFASATSTSIVKEEEEEDQEQGNQSASPSDEEGLFQSETPALNQGSENLSSVRGCQACGREEIEKGCNGEGRIQGGIATVPGFGWWPIKAYRPCPAYLATGGRYKRRGQSMDEVASGGMKRGSSATSNSKEKAGSRKFKN